MALVAPEDTSQAEADTGQSKVEAFKEEVVSAVQDIAADVVEKIEDRKADKGWIIPVLVGLFLLLAPLTIYKAVPYLKAKVTSPATVTTVKANPATELDAIFDKVRELSQKAASDVKGRKAALDERAVLIARVKVMSDTTNFKGASDLALEWLNRIKSDQEPAPAAPVVIKPKPTPAAPVAKPKPAPQVKKEAPEPEVVAPVVRRPAPVEPKCDVNGIGDCGNSWRTRASQQ